MSEKQNPHPSMDEAGIVRFTSLCEKCKPQMWEAFEKNTFWIACDKCNYDPAPAQPTESELRADDDIYRELGKAIAKFPTWPTDPLHAVAVLGEEYGELVKEVLQSVYEPHKSSMEEVKKEAIQCAAMAIRFVRSLDKYEFVAGVQHSQGDTNADA